MNHDAKAGFARLLLRCPSLRSELLEAASTPTMANICASYEAAWQAMMYWARVPGREAAAVVADFQRLIAALEREASHIAEPRKQRTA